MTTTDEMIGYGGKRKIRKLLKLYNQHPKKQTNLSHNKQKRDKRFRLTHKPIVLLSKKIFLSIAGISVQKVSEDR